MKRLHRRGPGTDIAAGFPCFFVGETGPLLLELLWGSMSSFDVQPECRTPAGIRFDSFESFPCNLVQNTCRRILDMRWFPFLVSYETNEFAT